MKLADASHRYERKLRLQGVEGAWVEALVHRHPAILREVFPPRWVNNVYFDTLRWSHYAAHVAGVAHRRKVRVRWYGSRAGRTDAPRLELKDRAGEVGTKRVYALPGDDVSSWAVPAAAQRLARSPGLPAAVGEQLTILQATLMNFYYRRYFETSCGAVRVTVDTRLSFRHPESLRGRSSFESRDHAVVVEIKFAAADHDRGVLVSEWFPFRLDKSSKYVTGVRLLGGSR